MSVVAAPLSLDEQKTVLKTCATSAASFAETNEENHILHKIKTSSSFSTSTSANSAACNVTVSKAAATAEGANSSNVFSQTVQSSMSHTSTSPAILTETSFTAQHRRLLEDEIHNLKIEQSRLHQQCNDAQRREKILMRRLANKEQEFQDYVSQIAEYKAIQAPGPAALRSALLDPAVNLLFEKIKKELQATKAKLEDTQQELAAWKFTPDSNTGKRLMAKCRLLHQENEELGKMTSNGRLAKLETELAMQKSFAEEVKKSQSELDDFLQELDEDVEGMQSTVLFLQQELKTTRERIQFLEKENFQLKNGISEDSQDAPATAPSSTTQPAPGNENLIAASPTDYSYTVNNNNDTTNLKFLAGNQFNVHGGIEMETIEEDSCLRTTNTNNSTNNSDFINGVSTNEIKPNNTLSQPTRSANSDGVIDNTSNSVVGPSSTKSRLSRKRNYDSDSSECDSINDVTISRNSTAKKIKKQKRRSSSVLSIELNEDDSHIGESLTGQSDGDNSNSQPTRIMTRKKSTRNYQNNIDKNV